MHESFAALKMQLNHEFYLRIIIMKKIVLIMMILACLVFVGCKKDGETSETTDTTADPNHVHEWSEVEVVEAPDCRFAGEGKKTCSCGAEEIVEIPALGHDVPENSYVENPTFTRMGVQAGVCTRCEKKIRSDAEPLKKEYIDITANIDSVNNVYFNGYWTNTQNGAFTSVLGSEVIAKVTGASKVTYTFEVSDASKSAVVAYSTDGINWTRHDLKTNATVAVTVPADETVVRVIFVDTELDMSAANTGITLKSVAADKGTVAPCVKEGVTALVISDSVTDLEKDVFSLATESLGITSYRISRKGLGYANLSAVLEAYIADENKAAAAPDFIIVSLGENDSDVEPSAFMLALSDVAGMLMDEFSGIDVMLVKPESGAKSGMLDTITAYYGAISTLDTEEWTTAKNADEKALKLEAYLVNIYGEKVFFEGYYDEYAEPGDTSLSTDKTNNNSFGELKPMQPA